MFDIVVRLAVILMFVSIVWLVCSHIEYVRCAFFCRQIPFVPSAAVLRRAVASEICRKYPNAKTVCDIGAGYGGLARYIARKTGADVVALENMPWTFFVARVLNFFSRTKVHNIRCDAFEYLDKYQGKFDIGVAYLGPGVNDRLVAVMGRFDVLIVLDVPIPGVNPLYVVDVGHGCTRYGRRKFPHKLFVYKK